MCEWLCYHVRYLHTLIPLTAVLVASLHSTRVRKTRAAMADTADTAAAGDAAALLASEGVFRFDTAPLKVKFVCGSAVRGAGLDQLLSFLQ